MIAAILVFTTFIVISEFIGKKSFMFHTVLFFLLVFGTGSIISVTIGSCIGVILGELAILALRNNGILPSPEESNQGTEK